jgi:hypothetical protein
MGARIMNHSRLLTTLALASSLGLPALAAPAHGDAVLLTPLGLYHFDTHSVSDKSGIKTVQTLLDYKTTQKTSEGEQYRSSQTEIQLNCKSQSARIMHTSYHSAAMGTGKEVFKEGSIREWMDVVKGTPIERIAHRVC